MCAWNEYLENCSHNPKGMNFCSHLSFRVLALGLPNERGTVDHWASFGFLVVDGIENELCFQEALDQSVQGRDPILFAVPEARVEPINV